MLMNNDKIDNTTFNHTSCLGVLEKDPEAAKSCCMILCVCVCTCVLAKQTLVLEPSTCQMTEELCSPSLWIAIFTRPQEVTLTSPPLLHSGASTRPVYSQRVCIMHLLYMWKRKSSGFFPLNYKNVFFIVT